MSTIKPLAILLSRVGRGKTTFYNKICNQQEKTYYGGSSCTKKLFLNCTSYGKGFYLMDTPGFGCDTEIIAHLSALFVAFERPLNAILILTKYDRSATMKEDIFNSLSMLSPCKDIIIIIVTCWDLIEDESIEQQEKSKRNIVEQVMNPLNLKSFILSGKNTSGDLICQQLDQIIQNNLKKSVQLTPQEFSFQFSKLSVFSITDEINTHELTQTFKNKCIAALKFIELQPDDTQETAELMHEIILTMKQEGHLTVTQFINQNRDKFDQLVEKYGVCDYTYLAHTKLKSQIKDQLEKVILKAQEKMQTYKYHVYNYIKQCPHCKLIWFKVSGCNDETHCGGKPSKDDRNLAPQPKKFKIFFKGADLEVINQSNFPEVINRTQVKKTANLVGCGEELDWKTLPPLTEDQFRELKDTGFLDVLSMVQDKDSKDIKNEKSFWEKLEELQVGQRQNLDWQIEQANEKQEQKQQQQSQQVQMTTQKIKNAELRSQQTTMGTQSSFSINQ